MAMSAALRSEVAAAAPWLEPVSGRSRATRTGPLPMVGDAEADATAAVSVG